MRHVQYGWRHSTNRIDDIKPAYTAKPGVTDRAGLDNFRPFEQLAQNLKVRQHYPRPNRTYIPIDFVQTSMPISVARYRPFQYTSIPPLSTLSVPGFGNGPSLYSSISDSLQSGLSYAAHTAGKVGTAFSAHITKPLAIAAAAVMSFLFGRRYTADSGLQRYWKTSVPAFAKPMLAIAGILIGAFVLAQVVSNSGASSTNNGSENTAGGSPPSSQNDASRAVTAPSSVPSTPSQSSTGTSGSNSSTQPIKSQQSQTAGTYWDVKSQTSKPASGSSTEPQSGTSWPAGGTGGETSSAPTTDSSAPAPSTTTTNPTAPVPSESTTTTSPEPTTDTILPSNPLDSLNEPILETETPTIINY